MTESFSANVPQSRPEEVEDNAVDKVALKATLHQDAAAAEKELFLDTDTLLQTIDDAWESIHGTDQGDPDVHQFNPDWTLTPYGVIQQHQERFLRDWSELLLFRAREASGSVRIRYASALRKLCFLVGEDTFMAAAKDLHVTVPMIDELIQKGRHESESNSFSREAP